MLDLLKILQKNSEHSDYDCLVRDIEIYVAKQLLFNIIKIGEDSIRIFPKDGSHFIDLSSNHGIEEKLFVVFQKIYEFGLHHYIEAIHFYGGNVSFKIKEMYSKTNVSNIFEEILKNEIKVCGDHLTYDFDYKG